MTGLLSIGEFARVSHMSVKALHHYDEIGLLKPADVDKWSGRRRYSSAQIPAAHVIRRFRDLDMSLDQIRTVLEAPDVGTRNRVIVEHLERMQHTLEHTRSTVESLKSLLGGHSPALGVECRRVDAVSAIAITGRVEWDDTEQWLDVAFSELHEMVSHLDPRAVTGADAALYSPEFFETHVGEVVAFLPTNGKLIVTGRAEVVEIPSAYLAMTVHQGPFSELDQAYAALGAFVTERALGTKGPIREYYSTHADNPSSSNIKVCWPLRHLPEESGPARNGRMQRSGKASTVRPGATHPPGPAS
jgi:DNA-binding transcriptional MerR regulator